jgi:Domain of unknown function (DUF4403)
MTLGKIIVGVLVIAVSFVGAIWTMDMLSGPPDRRPQLAEVPPLKPVARKSTVVTPVAISLTAIHDALEAAAPKNLTGKRDNVLTQLLQNAEIGWTVTRGPLAVAGRPEGLAVSTALNGTFRATGKIAKGAGNVTGALGNLLGGNLGQDLQKLTEKTLDQRTDIRGTVTVASRPALQASWRLEPNLGAQVALAEASMSILGMRLNIPHEVKPFLDRAVNEQIGTLQARVRSDPFIEAAARREWAKMCRSISLGSAAAGVPDLWLEVRPTRAYAGQQPRIDAAAVTLTIGVEAETRIVPSETKPNCPFPAQLELVPQIEQGRVNIAVPIDVPFTEVNRLLEARLKGKTFPQDKSGAFAATIRGVALAASGDRLLVSLRVRANENKSRFGLGAEATVHVWGRPVLDAANQVLQLSDIALDVQSEAAFGLLGAAARAALPYLKQALAENAVVDLKPLISNARTGIEAAIAEFRTGAEGVRVDAAITALRLTGIEFDAKTLRVIAEADGTANVAVTALPR